MQAIGGCSDGGCVIVKPKGMHTNGGCRCPRDFMKMQRLAYAAINLRKGISAILERPVVVSDEDVEHALNASIPGDDDDTQVREFIHGDPGIIIRAALESMVRGKS
jgi:hypothetical protein